MSKRTHNRWSDERIARGEVIGGGFIVLRRGRSLGRVKIDMKKLPFEHATLEKANDEARRLAKLFPGSTFSIFQQVISVTLVKEEDQ